MDAGKKRTFLTLFDLFYIHPPYFIHAALLLSLKQHLKDKHLIKYEYLRLGNMEQK